MSHHVLGCALGLIGLALLGCSGLPTQVQNEATAGQGASMSDEARIRAALGSAVPSQARVRADQEGNLAGARLYTVEGGGMASFGVAVVEADGETRVLRGTEAFRTLRPKVGADARALARLSVLFLEKAQAGAKVIPTVGAAPELMPDQAAMVSPPTTDGVELVYWRWPVPSGSNGMVTAPEPWKCTVDLLTFEPTCQPSRLVAGG